MVVGVLLVAVGMDEGCLGCSESMVDIPVVVGGIDSGGGGGGGGWMGGGSAVSGRWEMVVVVVVVVLTKRSIGGRISNGWCAGGCVLGVKVRGDSCLVEVEVVVVVVVVVVAVVMMELL